MLFVFNSSMKCTRLKLLLDPTIIIIIVVVVVVVVVVVKVLVV